MPPDRVDDGAVPLGTEGGQSEHGDADGDVLGGLGQLADEGAPGPRLERVEDGGKGHAADDDQQVAQRQAHDVCVGDVAHTLVAGEDEDQSAVAEDADDEDGSEHDRHDVRLGSLRVRDVALLCRVHGVH